MLSHMIFWDLVTICGELVAIFTDLLMGRFRGAVFHHGGEPENCPLALLGRFPSLMGRFPTLMGRFPECLSGRFSLLKIPWKTAHQERGKLFYLQLELFCLQLSFFAYSPLRPILDAPSHCKPKSSNCKQKS